MVQRTVAVAVVINNDIFILWLPDVEAKAIELALEYRMLSKNTHFRILSDSLSC